MTTSNNKDLLQVLRENWFLIMFIAGGAVMWGKVLTEIAAIQTKITTLEVRVNSSEKNVSEIQGDLKEIKANINFIKEQVTK